jgi:putative chitinase
MTALPINIMAMQRRLVDHGGGRVDGIAGPRTWAALFSAFGAGGIAEALGRGAAAHFDEHGITANGLRLAHFMAQMSHESGGFRFMREIWGPTPTQLRYEGRDALGNTRPGDGKRFMGRGIIQITGRANYAEYGAITGLDLINTPELAEHPENAVWIACAYWYRRRLNTLADADDVQAVTRRINGGLNGLADRQARTVKAKGLIL